MGPKIKAFLIEVKEKRKCSEQLKQVEQFLLCEPQYPPVDVSILGRGPCVGPFPFLITSLSNHGAMISVDDMKCQIRSL